MSSYFGNIRFWILLSSVLLSLAVYFGINLVGADDGVMLGIIRAYALLALAYLYITLLIGPATKIFTWLPYRGLLIKSRRGFGVSVFYFAWLHAILAFLNIIGGFSGFFLLPQYFQLAIYLGVFNLAVLTLMAATANDYMMAKLTFSGWKTLHRLVYIVAVSILIHATLIGHHFQGEEKGIGYLFYVGAAFLIGVHAYGLYLKSRDFDPNKRSLS